MVGDWWGGMGLINCDGVSDLTFSLKVSVSTSFRQFKLSFGKSYFFSTHKNRDHYLSISDQVMYNCL